LLGASHGWQLPASALTHHSSLHYGFGTSPASTFFQSSTAGLLFIFSNVLMLRRISRF
jgi:hypothetical protein